MNNNYSTPIAMDRIKQLCYIFLLYYLCTFGVFGKSLPLRRLLQDTPGDGSLTDLSHTANDRQHDHGRVATGQDQTDQNLHGQSRTSVGNAGDLDTVHASNEHVVAQLQDGHHEPGHNLDHAGQDQYHEYTSLDADGLTHGNDMGSAISDDFVNNDNRHIQSAIDNNDNSVVNPANGVLNTMDNSQDSDSAMDHSLVDNQQHSSIDQQNSLLDNIDSTDDYDVADDYVIPDSAAVVHQDVIDTHPDSGIASHSDSLTDHHGNAIPSPAVDPGHDSAIASHINSPAHNENPLPAHHDNVLPVLPHNNGMVLDSHNSGNDSVLAVSNTHSSDSGKHDAPEVHGNSNNNIHSEGSGNSPDWHNETGHQTDQHTGLLLDSELGHLDVNGGSAVHGVHSDSHVPDPDITTTGGPIHVDTHRGHIDIPSGHMDSSGGHIDSPGGHIDTPSGHIDVPGGHIDSPGGHIGMPGGHIDTPSGHIDTPSGHIDTPSGHIDTPSGHIDTPSGHIDTPSGHIDSPGGHIDTPSGHIDNPGGHIDTHGAHGAVIVDPSGGLDHSAGGHVPGTDNIHEGSGSPSETRTDHGNEPGIEPGSGSHALPPSHNLPPSHEGHEVHPDNLPGSGDGPNNDKDGGIHDLSHHEDHEPEHVNPGRPIHTVSAATSTGSTTGSTTTVKVFILPSPVEPEVVDHSRTTTRSHTGEEIEGSGTELHPVPVLTTRTTPSGEVHEGQGHEHQGHEGQGHEGQGHEHQGHEGHENEGEGHIIAVTTTQSGQHRFEGSGSETGHEGHRDEHEGEGHLPGEGSGQEPGNHEGISNTTVHKPDKEQTKGEVVKNSSFVLPSEVPYEIQPSSVVADIPTSSGSDINSVTEPNSGISGIPVFTSESLQKVVLYSSFSSEEVTSVSNSRTFSPSTFPTPELLTVSVTESSIPLISTSSEYIQSRMSTESLLTGDKMTYSISSEPFTSSFKVSESSSLNSEELSPSSSTENIEALMSTSASSTPTTSHSSQTIRVRTSKIPSLVSTVKSSFTESFTIVSSLIPTLTLSPYTAAGPSEVFTTLPEAGTKTSASLSSFSQSISTESTSVRGSLSPSRTQSAASPVTPGHISPTSSTTSGYSVVTQPILSSTTRMSTSGSTTSSTSTPSSLQRSSMRSTVASSRTSIQSFISMISSPRTTPSSARLTSTTLTFPRYPPTMTNIKTILVPVTRNTTLTSVLTIPALPRLSTAASRPGISVPSHSASVIPSLSPRVKSTLSELLTTLLSTTKRKNISMTTLTTTTTSKKPSSPTTKGPDKPSPSTSTLSHTRRGNFSNNRSTERTSLNAIHEVKTPSSPIPPSVFVQVELRMTWSEFCSKKTFFIADLKEIIQVEKQVFVDEERFKISNLPPEFCRRDWRNWMTSQIQIHVYIMNDEGGVDVRLTIDLSTVIEKGFRTLQSEFKDKFVRAQLFRPDQSFTTPPPLRNSPVREVQMSPGITMVTIIASVGGACCVILIILQILIRRRILQKKARPVIWGQRASLQSLDHVALGSYPKTRPESGYWNPALDLEEIPEPSPQSHLVNFAGLANFSLDKNRIYEEFQMIPFETPEKCDLPVNVEEKNRFANVLPFKATRVRLQKKEGVDNSDYINANYIKGYRNKENAYIATQSPMINTAEDFWRMVWEQQSKVILMLNPLNDTGKPKMCTMYWPSEEGSDCVKQFGDYAITLKKKDVQQDYIETTLQLRDMERNLKREIHHFWFTTWPETGLPEPLAFVKFILDTRPRYEDTGTPLVVHCGPGTGRTGVLIAVDICMRMFEEKRRVDVLQCVHQMRKERAGSVQTRDQYMLIYQALNEYAVILSSPSMSTRSSVITLHAML